MKKRVKLHAYENGENGQTASRENGQHAQNEDIDSDDNYTEVRRNQPSRESRDLQNTFQTGLRVFGWLFFFSCVQDIMSPLQEESGCEEDEGEDEEESREEEEAGFDSDESLVDSDSDSDEKGVFVAP